MSALPRLMLVTDRHGTRGRDLVEVVAPAAAAGPCLVQIREKDLDDEALAELVARIRARVPARTIVVVNSSATVARATGCGLHLPVLRPLADATGLPLVGRSVHDEEQAVRAAGERADYLVAGPIYPTPSKPGHPGAGLALLHAIVPRVAPIPVFAIGGVRRERVGELIAAGAHGVAVCRAILTAGDPRAAARALIAAACGTELS